MLEKIRIIIGGKDAAAEEQKERLKERLLKEGLEVEMGLSVPDSGKPRPAAGELYLTDCPEQVRRLTDGDCRILLYLTEESRRLPMTEYPYAVEELEEIDAGYLEGIYRRLVGEPWEILQTERLLVREQREEDLDSLYEIYAHPDMTAYMEGLAEDREEEKERLQNYIRTVYPLYGFGLWMLVKRERGREGAKTGRNGTGRYQTAEKKRGQEETGKGIRPEPAGGCVGRAGFFWREGAGFPELGFAIKKSEQRKGYCLEACRAILEYGFKELGFSGVQALTREENRAAATVLARLGFQRRGVTQADGKRAARWILLRPQEGFPRSKEGGERTGPQWKAEDPCGRSDRSVWEEPAP